VEQYELLVEHIVVELRPLLCCHVHQLYLTLLPASTSICWNAAAASWTPFFEGARRTLEQFRRLYVRLEVR